MTERSYTEVTAIVEMILGKLNPDELDRLRKDEEYRYQIIQFIQCGRGLVPSIPFSEVENLLGNNVFGPKEWETIYKAPVSSVSRLKAEWFPWTREDLLSSCPFEPGRQVAETHFAFFGKTSVNGRKLTVDGWIDLHKDILQIESFKSSVLGEQGEWRDREVCGEKWHLIYMGAMSIDPNKIIRQPLPEWGQREFLPSGYGMTCPIETVTSHLLYYLRNNSPWPGNFVIKTKNNVVPCGQIAITSWHYDNGRSIRIRSLDDRDFKDDIGIGAIRFPPETRDPMTI
ncbi:MAG: hypothetical protein WC536_00755 [Patescibacteria group bacterium]